MAYVILSKMHATWSTTLIRLLKKALGIGEAVEYQPIVVIDTFLVECHKPLLTPLCVSQGERFGL